MIGSDEAFDDVATYLPQVFAKLFQLLPEKRVDKCVHEGFLLVVGRASVTTFDVFVIDYIVPHRLHLGHHLTGVSGMHTIVARRGDKKRTGISRLFVHVVIRGERADEGPFLWNIRIAVFPYPTCSGEQLVIALHVKQGHEAHNGAKEVRAVI